MTDKTKPKPKREGGGKGRVAGSGRKPWIPSDTMRGQVMGLKAAGAQHWFIARELGISRDKLEKVFRTELDNAQARTTMRVEANLVRMTEDKVGAAVFYLINRAGDRWKDRMYLEGNINLRDAAPPDFTHLTPAERDVLREATAIIRKAQERKLIDVTPGKERPDDEDRED